MTALAVGPVLLIVAIGLLVRAGSVQSSRLAVPVLVVSVSRRWPDERLGSLLRDIARRPAHPARDRMVGRTALFVFAVAPFSLVLALLVMCLPAVGSWLAKRRQRQLRSVGIHSTLAELIDLYAVVLHNGHNLVTATNIVAQWAPGEAGQALRWCCDQSDQGERLSDALDQLPNRFDPVVGPLVSALVAHDRYGAQIGPTLTLLAHDARQDQRRRAEMAARRLPVALLFPLVTCVLPSFLLLTVIPLSIQALSSFEL